MLSIRFISLQAPAIVSQHIDVPAAMVSFLHDTNILVKSLTLLLAVITRVVRKVVQVRTQEMELYRHARPKVMETL
jgi:hypothetical protein